jgi:predicted transcriptional regulator
VAQLNAGAHAAVWHRDRSMAVRGRGFGALEAVVMDRIWNQDGTTTVRVTLDELAAEREIAYTTVMSTMDNLHTKGGLAAAGQSHCHRPAVKDVRDQVHCRTHRLLRASDGLRRRVAKFVADPLSPIGRGSGLKIRPVRVQLGARLGTANGSAATPGVTRVDVIAH